MLPDLRADATIEAKTADCHIMEKELKREMNIMLSVKKKNDMRKNKVC